MNPTENADRRHAAERHLASLDDDWARLIATVGPCGLAPGQQSEPWQALVRTVAWQQLHGRAAEAIFGRFLALHGGDFPSPGRLLATDPAALRGCGFSARKVDTIRGIAEAVQGGIVPARDDALAMDDAELAARLTGLRGIGRWTVDMLRIFTLEHPDVLPGDDFGVRDGYRRLKSLDALPTARQMTALGAPCSPYRSAASWYLWRVPK
ncbi:MAG: DNA-3-methyladenine glycosylase 2 family protein [Methyloversatilis sp.]|jgi:DNA-3-methyladenine glycosylase II|nr:DNA-3-methyladenine glycosylase 2 family protein [Methyloversatilis sp.]MBP6194364.1 DNA-3-methyladenine glycosylase 2 family protein [Methyloversatilis sp.]